MPKISVIVPVYKVEPYLHRCIDSILDQKYADFELILVNDGSPDRCPVICDEYAEKDKRVKVIHKSNGGVSSARNAGIERALSQSDSQYITFIDSDDWIEENYLEVLLFSALDNNAEISACRFYITNGEERENRYEDTSVELVDSEIFYTEHNDLSCGPWVKIFQKDLFRNVRFPEDKFAEDAFTMYRVILPVKRVAYNHAELYAYYQSHNSQTRSSWTPKKLDLLDAIQEIIDYSKQHDKPKVYYREIAQFVKETYYNIYLASECSALYEEEALKKRLRKFLIKYRNEYKMTDENMHIFSTLWPKTIKCILCVKAVIVRIRKLLNV